jgi:hypothetical protein
MAALSGQRTFLEIQGDIAAILGDGFAFGTTSYPTLTQAKQIINRHYKQFTSKRPWKWMQKSTTFNTVAGTTQYTLVDGVAEEITLRIANQSMPLNWISREQFLQQYPGGWTTTGNGLPTMYVPSAEASNNALQIDLWPTPDAVYTVTMDYRARAAPLAADGDYSVVPPEYEDALVFGPAAEMLTLLGDQRSAVYENKNKENYLAAWMEDERQLNAMNGLRNAGSGAGPSIWFPFQG